MSEGYFKTTQISTKDLSNPLHLYPKNINKAKDKLSYLFHIIQLTNILAEPYNVHFHPAIQ